MNASFTSAPYRAGFFIFSIIFCAPIQAVTAFQEQIMYKYEKLESIGNADTTQIANINFQHFRQLVNPFAGPVDEAAFLNHIGSLGFNFNYVRLKTDIGAGLGKIDTNGIGYQFEYTHIVPYKPLTASLKIGKHTIEDELSGGVLLEGTIKSTTLSFGIYIDESSHINLTSRSQKIDYRAVGFSIPQNATNSLTLRYKKVIVNAAKKSFNLEAAYQKGDLPTNGAAQNNNFTSILLLADIYFNSQTKFGFGYASNTDKNPIGSDSRTFTLRGSFYLGWLSAMGFSYSNTNFDANIENEKSFSIHYKRQMM